VNTWLYYTFTRHVGAWNWCFIQHSCQRAPLQGQRSFPVASFVIDDGAEVGQIMTILPLLVILSYPSMSITFSQASVATRQRCFFALSALCPIFGLVATGGLAPVVTYWWLYCNDLAHHFSPLLRQSHQWSVLRYQALDWLHDGLEPNNIEVWIEVLNHYVAGCACIGWFRSPDGWVSARTVTGKCSSGTHNADAIGLNGWVP
jgi:hypothetical protein